MIYLLIAYTFITSIPEPEYDLSDFRIPQAGVSTLTAKFSLSSPIIISKETSDSLVLDEQLHSIGGSASVNWQLNLLSEKYYLYLMLNPSLGGSYQRLQYIVSGNVDTSELLRVSRYGGILSTSSDIGWYLGNSIFFIGVMDTIKTNLFLDSYISDTENIKDLTKEFFIEFYSGPGIGKVRDVAPAVYAWQFLEEIDAASYENINTLAGLLAKEWKYDLHYSRHEKYFYLDVEKLLQEKGVTSGLSVYNLMRLKELKSLVADQRLFGNRFNLEVGGKSTDFGDFLFGPRFRVTGGYPLSRHWQLSWNGIENLTVRSDTMKSNLYTRFELSWYLGDRWKISTALEAKDLLNFQRIQTNNYNLLKHSFALDFPVKVQYYLEDKLSFTGEANYGYYRPFYPNTGYMHEFYIYFGLSWRLH